MSARRIDMNMRASRRESSAGTCHYCGTAVYAPGSPQVLANKNVMATKDHIYPQFWSTSDDRSVLKPVNVVTCCNLCNNVKGGYPHEVFKFFLARTRGTANFNPVEFKKLVFGLALAGFHAACREVASRRTKPAPLRGPQGRFTKRDLRAKTGRGGLSANLSPSEPGTLQEMHARNEDARRRMYAAARRYAAPPPPAPAVVAQKAVEPVAPPAPAVLVRRYLLSERGRANLSHRLAEQAAEIICRVAEEHGISPFDILSRSGSRRGAHARQHAYAAISEAFPDWSLPSIGHLFGRDHSSVLHGLQRIGAWPRGGAK